MSPASSASSTPRPRSTSRAVSRGACEYRDHEELGAFLTKLTGALESEVEPERLIDDEEGHVVQIGRTRGRVRATGNEFDVPETHVWTVEDGRVTRFESYIDTPKMREALGL